MDWRVTSVPTTLDVESIRILEVWSGDADRQANAGRLIRRFQNDIGNTRYSALGM